MTFKSLETAEINRDYTRVWHKETQYLIPFQEIADFTKKTVYFKGVYEVVSETPTNPPKVVVSPIEDIGLLEEITKGWERAQVDEVVSRHQVSH